MSSFFFCELELITVLLLICESYMSRSARFVSLKLFLKFSIFDSVPFLLNSIFLFNKTHGLFNFKASWFLSKLKLYKSRTQFCSEASDFEVATGSCEIQWYLREMELPKTDLVTNFLNPENRSFENVSIVIFK